MGNLIIRRKDPYESNLWVVLYLTLCAGFADKKINAFLVLGAYEAS